MRSCRDRTDDTRGGEVYRSATLGPLVRGELTVGQGAVDVQTGGFEVHIPPLESQQLAGPQAGVDGQHVKGFEPLPFGSP
jgi:hypothetical protein